MTDRMVKTREALSHADRRGILDLQGTDAFVLAEVEEWETQAEKNYGRGFADGYDEGIHLDNVRTSALIAERDRLRKALEKIQDTLGEQVLDDLPRDAEKAIGDGYQIARAALGEQT